MDVNTAPAIPHSLDDRDFIERLLFQMDNTFHARVNITLVAGSIFFAAAAAAWNYPFAFAVIAAMGIVLTLAFTVASVKAEFRVRWLIGRLKAARPVYVDYLELKGMDFSGNWRLTKAIASWTAREGGAIVAKTGWLYTWALCLTALAGWVLLVIGNLGPKLVERLSQTC
jgi:hypothetical protein